MRFLSIGESRVIDPSFSKNSIVIGFGRELKWIDCILSNAYADVYVANLSKERFADASFESFLRNQDRIHIVANISEEVVSFRHACWLHRKISSVNFVGFDPRLNPSHGNFRSCSHWEGTDLVRHRVSRRLDIYGHLVSYLPQAIGVDFTCSLRNTGLIAIHLAASRSSIVHCIGFNFYSAQNFEGALSSVYGEEASSLVSVSKTLWKNFYRVVDNWRNKQFVLYVERSYEFIEGRSNLEIIILSELS